MMKVIDELYPLSITRSIDRIIQECMSEESISPFTANAVNYLIALFPKEPYNYFPSDAFGCIWNNLLKFQSERKINWIKAYWEYAVSYANYSLNVYLAPEEIAENVKDLLFRFQEFHHMYCAYLLYSGEYDLLKHMIDYSTSSDGTNSLIPDNINGIIEHIKQFDRQFYVEQNYSFYLNKGVGEGELIFGWLICFYLLRIIMKEDININTSKDLKELVTDSKSFEKLNNMYKRGRLWSQLNSSNLFKSTFGITDNKINDFDQMMDKVNTTFKDSISTKRGEIISDEELKEEFKSKVNRYVKKYLDKYNFPVDFVADCDDYDKKYVFKIPANKYPKDVFTNNPSIAYLNIPESYSIMSIYYISQLYERNFLLTSPVKSYIINYSEISIAIEKLKLNNEFVVISFGVDLSQSKDSQLLQENIFNVKSRLWECVILKKCDCPKLVLNDPIIKFNIEDEEYTSPNLVINGEIIYRYNNLTDIPKSHIDQTSISFNGNITLRYVRLRLMNQNYAGIKSALPDIVPISNFIV